jgi:hypothetical protein
MSGGFMVALVPYAVAILFMDAPDGTGRGAITIGFVVIGGWLARWPVRCRLRPCC